jgi:hypothetical protein
MEELRTLILKNGCFDIVRLVGQRRKYHTISVMEFKAGLEGIFSKHFGSESVDHLFNRYAKIIAGRPLINAAADDAKYMMGLFVLLKRKN